MPRLLPARRPNVSDEMIQAARLGRLFPELNPESEWPDSWKRVAFRDAAQLPMVPLGPSRPIDMVDLLLRHESSRDLRPDPILAEQVSTLMTAVAINRNGSTADFAESRRTYPIRGRTCSTPDPSPFDRSSGGTSPGKFAKCSANTG